MRKKQKPKKKTQPTEDQRLVKRKSVRRKRTSNEKTLYAVYLWNRRSPEFYVSARNKREAEKRALTYFKKHALIKKA